MDMTLRSGQRGNLGGSEQRIPGVGNPCIGKKRKIRGRKEEKKRGSNRPDGEG